MVLKTSRCQRWVFLSAYLLPALCPPAAWGSASETVREFHTSRSRAASAMHAFVQSAREYRQGQEAGTSNRRVESVQDQDLNDVAVVEDDGSIVADPNPADLTGKTIRFEPVTGGGYQVTVRTSTFDTVMGSALSLEDNDGKEVAFASGFRFPFHGTSYDKVYVNTNGNLTFTKADPMGGVDWGITGQDQYEFLHGPPRIAPLFCDLLPIGSSAVFVNMKTDRATVTWNNLEQYYGTGKNLFQVVLFPGGAIEFVFGSTLDTPEALSGLSPGGANTRLTALDLTKGSSTTLTGAIAEWFHPQTEVDLVALGNKFYRTHSDRFQFLTLFSNFSYNMDGLTAYSISVKNLVKGLGDISFDGPGQDLYDDSALFGSAGSLEHFIHMSDLSRYLTDPSQAASDGLSFLDLMDRHTGHRWLSYVYAKLDGARSHQLLGRDDIYWNFFLHSDSSVMGGNSIRDNGDGTFLTGDIRKRFSQLDQYLMGLRWEDEVSPFFVVTAPSGTTKTTSSEPAKDVSFRGTRKNVTVQNVIAEEGLRQPTPKDSPKVFNNAFILLTRRGVSPSQAELAKMQLFRQAYEKRFGQLAEQRGFVDTRLSATEKPLIAYLPLMEGDANRFTALAIANRAAYPATVRLTAYTNAGQLMNLPGMANPSVMAVGAGNQRALIDSQWFHFAMSESRQGWIRLESSTDQVAAFFLSGDLAQTQLDGGLALPTAAGRILFTRVLEGSGSFLGQSATTAFSIVNPGENAATLQITLWSAAGLEVARAQASLAAKGRLRQTVAQLFPGATLPISAGWVEVQSTQPVIGFEMVQFGSTLFGLPAQLPQSARKLYSAQFASGGVGQYPSPFFTSLCLVNTGTVTAGATIRVVAENGSLLTAAGVTNPLQRSLPAKGTLCGRADQLFGFPADSTDTQPRVGSLIVELDGGSVSGDVVFGDALKGAIVAGLPLQSALATDMIFSQVAEGVSGNPPVGYFTGIAALNPNAQEVQLQIEVFTEDGQSTGSRTLSLAAGNRFSQVLRQLVPASAGQMRGFVRVRSTGGGVAIFELFGDGNLASFLAAVPPQPFAVAP